MNDGHDISGSEPTSSQSYRLKQLEQQVTILSAELQFRKKQEEEERRREASESTYSDATSSPLDRKRRQQEAPEDAYANKFELPQVYAHYVNEGRRRQHKTIYPATHETSTIYNRTVQLSPPVSFQDLDKWAEGSYAYLPLSTLTHFRSRQEALTWKQDHISQIHPQQFLLWDRVFADSEEHISYLLKHKPNIAWLHIKAAPTRFTSVKFESKHKLTIKARERPMDDVEVQRLQRYARYTPFTHQFLDAPEELRMRGINLSVTNFPGTLKTTYSGGTVHELLINLLLSYSDQIDMPPNQEILVLHPPPPDVWPTLIDGLYNEIRSTLSSPITEQFVSEELITIHAVFWVLEDQLVPQPVSTHDPNTRGRRAYAFCEDPTGAYRSNNGLAQSVNSSVHGKRYRDVFDQRQRMGYEQVRTSGELILPTHRAARPRMYPIERAVLILHKTHTNSLRIDPMFAKLEVSPTIDTDRSHTVDELMHIVRQRINSIGITSRAFERRLWDSIRLDKSIDMQKFYSLDEEQRSLFFINMSEWEADKGGSDNTSSLSYEVSIPNGTIKIRKHSLIHVGGSSRYNTCPITYIIKLMRDLSDPEYHLTDRDGKTVVEPELKQMIEIKDRHYQASMALENYSVVLMIPKSNTSSQSCFFSALRLFTEKDSVLERGIVAARKLYNKHFKGVRRLSHETITSDFELWITLRKGYKHVPNGVTPEEAMSYISERTNGKIALDLYSLIGRSHIGTGDCVEKRVQMLYYDNHYVAIKDTSDTRSSCEDTPNEYDSVETQQSHADAQYFCFFDYETVVSPGNTVLPYSVCWSLYKVLPSNVEHVQPSNVEHVQLSSTLKMVLVHTDFKFTEEPGHSRTTTEMVSIIHKAVNTPGLKKIKVKMIAWNGSRFDFPILLAGMERSGVIRVLPTVGLSPTGRMPEATVEIGCVQFKYWDPKNFVINSLEKAAKSYACELTHYEFNKYEFNHDVIQQEYVSKGRISSADGFVENLKRYNLQDVRLLTSTVVGMFRSFNKAGVSDNITQTRTIASLTYRRLKEIGNEYRYNACHNSETKQPDKNVDKFIRRAIVAGRVSNLTGSQGIWWASGSQLHDQTEHLLDTYEVSVNEVNTSKFVKVDVKSLYPSVAIACDFPDVGKDGTDWVSTNKYAGSCISGCEGVTTHLPTDDLYIVELSDIVWNKVENTKLALSLKGTLMPCPIPTRDKEGRLNWFGYPEECVTTSVTLQDCMNSGLIKSYVVGNVLVFPTKAPLLRDYMLMAKKMKEDNDPPVRSVDGTIVSGNPDADPLVREVGKHCLNDPTGKLIQKQRYHMWRLKCGRQDTHVSSDVLDTMLTPSANLWIKTQQNRMQNIPSQVGVFIYAYARRLMWEGVFSHYSVYYSDTDSAILRNRDYVDLERRGLCVGLQTTNKLFGKTVPGLGQFGKFEVENNKISLVIVQGPKAYCTVDTNGVTAHMKGIRTDDKVMIKSVTLEDDKVVTLKDDGLELFCALLSPDVESVSANVRMFINQNGLRNQKIEKHIKL